MKEYLYIDVAQIHFMLVGIQSTEQSQHSQRLSPDRHQLLRLQEAQQQFQERRELLVRLDYTP